MTKVTATEMQNNFGKYLALAQEGEEIIVMKNGREAARLISGQQRAAFLTDSLIGVLSGTYDAKEIREERLQKYEDID